MLYFCVFAFVTIGVFTPANGKSPYWSDDAARFIGGGLSAREPHVNGSLDLSNLGLVHFPRGFIDSPSLTWLSLEGNRLSDIPSETLNHVPQLSYLSLADNRIQHINLTMFSGLSRLETLVLDGQGRECQYYVCGLFTISMDASTNLSALKHLYLRNCRIEQISFPATGSLPMLTHLFISGNNLAVRDPAGNTISDMFSVMPALKYIELENTHITTLDVSTLGGLTSLFLGHNGINSLCNQYCSGAALRLGKAWSLETLSAPFNQIKNIKSDAFTDTHNLAYLNLSNNQIVDVQEGTFSKLPLLQYISLDHNELSNIDGTWFSSDLSNLTHLFLSNNRISEILFGSFKHLPAVKKIFLEHNCISYIASGAFSNLPVLEDLSFEDNKLSTLSPGWLVYSQMFQSLNLANNYITDVGELALNETLGLLQLNLAENPLRNLQIHPLIDMSEDLNIVLAYKSQPSPKSCSG